MAKRTQWHVPNSEDEAPDREDEIAGGRTPAIGFHPGAGRRQTNAPTSHLNWHTRQPKALRWTDRD